MSNPKEEIRQLVTELHQEIRKYNELRNTSNHVSELMRIARGLKEHLDRVDIEISVTPSTSLMRQGCGIIYEDADIIEDQ